MACKIVLQGKVTPKGFFERASELREWFAASHGKEIVIEAKQYRKKRSNKQSEYRWAVVVPEVMRVLKKDNPDITKKTVNQILKKVTGYYYHQVVVGDMWHDIFLETGKDETAMFEEWMEACRAWAAENLDLQIPLPNEGILY